MAEQYHAVSYDLVHASETAVLDPYFTRLVFFANDGFHSARAALGRCIFHGDIAHW